jgi:hypothetical protein
MLQDMQLRNLSPHTQNAYVRSVAKLAAYFKTPPDQIEPEQVRAFLVHLVEKNVSFSLFNQTRCALVFFTASPSDATGTSTASPVRNSRSGFPSFSARLKSLSSSQLSAD